MCNGAAKKVQQCNIRGRNSFGNVETGLEILFTYPASRVSFRFLGLGLGRSKETPPAHRVLLAGYCLHGAGGPGSIPRLYAICGSSLLVLYSAPRGFSPDTPVFPSPQKPTFAGVA